MAQKPVLGKGLASLFPGASATPPQAVAPESAPEATSQVSVNRDRHPGISLAQVDEIRVNQFQPRRDFRERSLEDLAQSIRANGIIQPLIVRKSTQGYELIAGERRLRAAKLAGLRQVPIVIRKSTDREALELALIENIQREELNCVDEALAYFQLIEDFSLTQEELALRVGKDRATISNHLRLLRLPEPILVDLKKQVLTLGHAKALLGLEDSELRDFAWKEVVSKKLSVREAEVLVEKLKNRVVAPSDDRAAKTADTPVEARLSNISQQMTRRFSTRVELQGSERRGKIVFYYGSRDQLDRLLEALQNNKIWPEQ